MHIRSFLANRALFPRTQERPNYKVLTIKPQVAWNPVSCRKAASSLCPSPRWMDVLLCPHVSYHHMHKRSGPQPPQPVCLLKHQGLGAREAEMGRRCLRSWQSRALNWNWIGMGPNCRSVYFGCPFTGGVTLPKSHHFQGLSFLICKVGCVAG